MRPISNQFQAKDYPDLLVGLDAPDDAAVWKIDENRALVLTTDFFTPVVDDPYPYGLIAAANSISDIYAMGGKPFLAINIAAFPPELPPEFLSEIIRGGAEKAREAGVVVAGGHTIQDKEPKFGLVVIGFVDPQKMLTKGGARPGDRLVLTKPLGFGVTTTALKRGQAAPEDVDEAIQWMSKLNAQASQLAVEFGVRSATDITGYSLLGHSLEMANASQVAFKFQFNQLPFLTHARKYAEAWTFPGGASDNRLYFQDQVHFAPSISELKMMLMFDPQTSGGLLLSVPADQIHRLEERAAQIGQPIWQIGEVIEGAGIYVE